MTLGCALAALTLAVLTLSCAAVGPPGGGPLDETPPAFLGSDPASGSIGVDPATRVMLYFSEPINAATLSEALIVSPPQSQAPRISVSGSRASITLADSIPTYRTVILTIGGSVSDWHGIRIGESKSIALTAGTDIPSRYIEGQIFNATALMEFIIGAWDVTDPNDTSRFHHPPSYATYAGSDGRFRLDYLPPGGYYLCAWHDRDRNHRYDTGVEAYGIPWMVVDLMQDSTGWMGFIPQVRDSLPNEPLSIRVSDAHHVVVRFRRTLTRPSDVAPNRIVIDSDTSQLSIDATWIDPIDSSRFMIRTGEQTSGAPYRLRWIDRFEPLTFEGSNQPDTLAPMIARSWPQSGSRDVPTDLTGWIVFDDALDLTSTYDALLFVGEDTIGSRVGLHLVQSNRFEWKPDTLLPAGARCELRIDLTRIIDQSGNRGDSLWSLVFVTADQAEHGSISGLASHPYDEGSPLRIAARRIEGVGRITDLIEPAQSDGSFRVGMLAAGSYLLWGWLDRDEDGRYSYGSDSTFAEPFSIHPDTIQVRSRWETGGIQFRLR
ncbi:MAG: hypothetical protein FJY67_08715 [Calditrichaeota bacterium]|nr:hypothetical protein [Calditrichota bacterium]